MKKFSPFMDNKKLLRLIAVIFSCCVSAQQQQKIEMELVFTHDVAANMAGGIRQESFHLGNIDFIASADLWQGGTWFFYVLSNYGGMLSAAVGDLQVSNNIEATPHTRLYEFGYRHRWDKFTLTLGQNDLNATFAISDHGLHFINSSFGIQPELSTNVAIPIFPVAALGIVADWQYSINASFLVGVYDGDPGTPEGNPHSLLFQLGQEDGILGIAEWQRTISIANQTGKFRAGYWYSGRSSTRDDLSGFYAILDQKIFSFENNPNLGLALFGQWGIVQPKASVFKSYFGAGAVYYGVFNRTRPDELGIAFARATMSDSFRASSYTTPYEGVVELSYTAALSKKWKLQPNLQWILHPGANSTIQNALVGVLRFEYSIF